MLGAAPPLDARATAALARALPDKLHGLQQWEVSALMRGAALLLGPALQVRQGLGHTCHAAAAAAAPAPAADAADDGDDDDNQSLS